MAVNKINGFAAPYRSATLRGEADSLVGRNGVLSIAQDVYEQGGSVVIPPFKVIQQGLIIEKTNVTSVIKPLALVPPYYVTVSVPSSAITDDLVFQFAKSPLDIAPNEVILAEYDGNEWRQLPRVSIDGVLADKAQEVIEKGQVGPYSGLLTSVVGGNYKNTAGLLFDKTGSKVRFDSDLLIPIVASDPNNAWRRVDRMVYRRPVDDVNRIGVRKLILGGSFAPSGPKTINLTALNAGGSVSTNTRSIIASDNTAHVFYMEGFGTSFKLLYKKVSSDRSTVVTTATIINTLDSNNYSLAIDSANHIHVVYQNAGNINLLILDINGAVVTGPIVVENQSSPCSNPTAVVDPLNAKLYIAYEYLQGPNNKQIYFCTRDLAGNLVTPSVRVTNTLSNVINPNIDVSSDLAVHMVYEDAGVIKFLVLDDIGNILEAEQIVSANVNSTSFGVRNNGATQPTVKVSDNKEVFIFFRQKKNATDYGMTIWHDGVSFLPNLILPSENFEHYSVYVDSMNNDIHFSISQAGMYNYILVNQFATVMNEPIILDGINDCFVTKDKFGSLLHSWSAKATGTYSNIGTPQNVDDIGPFVAAGSLNTLVLTDHQASFPISITTVPVAGMMMEITGSSNGNNTTYLITDVNVASINANNDTYIVTVSVGFTAPEAPATGVVAQFQTPDGTVASYVKSVAEKDEIRALTTNTLPSDIILARMSWPGPIILNYIPQSGVGVNSDLFGMYGDIDVDWSYTAANSLTMTNGLGIIDLLTSTVYNVAGGTYPMNEGDALYITLDGVNTNITPVVSSITSLPWATPIQVLGFRKNGEFHPHLFSVAGMGQLDVGEQIELGQDLSKAIRIRLGITSETTMAPYTSTTIIAPSDPYPTALSKIDAALAAFSLVVPQEEDFVVPAGGQSVFTATVMEDWSPLNTVFDIVVYINGIKQRQDTNGAQVLAYRKVDEKTIETSEVLREYDVVSIRKERTGAPPIGGGTDLTNIAVDMQPIANGSNSVGSVSKAFKSVFLKDSLSAQVYELKIIGGVLQAVAVP